MLGARMKTGSTDGRNMPPDRLRLVVNQHRPAAGAAETGQRPGDRIRRGVLAGSPPTPSADLTARRLAEEIAHTRRLLVALGERMVADATVVARHARTLQSFDVIAQMLGHVGNVVGAADKDAAIERIGMVDLRARITRRSIADETLVPSS